MARMNYVETVNKSWVKNPIVKIIENTYIDVNKNIIAQELPTGKLIEIIYFPQNKTFKFSPDSQRDGSDVSVIGEYLKKFIYIKLMETVNSLFNQQIHFYGYIGKSGFHGIDIFVNDNWLDWDLVEALYKESKIRTPNTIFTGNLKEFNYNPIDNFIIRSVFEPPNERSIYYFKLN